VPGDPNGPVVLVDMDVDEHQVGRGRGVHAPEHRHNHPYLGLAAPRAGRRAQRRSCDGLYEIVKLYDSTMTDIV
jgi:hypothetical protein